jgi:hypothetical protein
VFLSLARPRFYEEVESNSSSAVKPRFVPTKWQSIDPNQVAAQGNLFFSNTHTKIVSYSLSCYFIEMGFRSRISW